MPRYIPGYISALSWRRYGRSKHYPFRFARSFQAFHRRHISVACPVIGQAFAGKLKLSSAIVVMMHISSPPPCHVITNRFSLRHLGTCAVSMLALPNLQLQLPTAISSQYVNPVSVLFAFLPSIPMLSWHVNHFKYLSRTIHGDRIEWMSI